MSAPRHSPTPEPGSIVRLVVTNWILGAALGAVCAALLLWFDAAGLRDLMFRDTASMTAGLALLFGGFAVTFGSVVCGSAIMMLAPCEQKADDPGGTHAPADLALSRVAVRGARRRA